MDLVDHISSQFSLPELVLVAEQIGLAPTGRWGSRRLIDFINAKIDRDGLPEPPDVEDLNNLDRKEILIEEYLYVAGYVDNQGRPVDRRNIAADSVIKLEEFMSMHAISRKPDCFSITDDKDPACRRCLLYLYCAQERLAKLPPCFALSFDQNCADCNVCLDAPFCKEATLAKQKDNVLK